MGIRETITVGDVLEGKYEVKEMLGSGAMGLVYGAVHQTLHRKLAVKTLRAEIASDSELVDRFKQEARAASAIGNPHIVQIFDAGQTPTGTHYIVMERLEGKSLEEELEQQPIVDPARVISLTEQILSGLTAAHRQGIVHRDLKPANIFLARQSDGTDMVKLLDFGISKVLESADPLIAGGKKNATTAGGLLGTPLYMSPEQARGHGIDHRTDIWSMGVVMYEMLCAQPPFDHPHPAQILTAILDGRFPRPRERRPSVPATLEGVILTAMAYSPDDRYQSAEEMARALTQAGSGLRRSRGAHGDTAPAPDPGQSEGGTLLAANPPAPGIGSSALEAAPPHGAPTGNTALMAALSNIDEASLTDGASAALSPEPKETVPGLSPAGETPEQATVNLGGKQPPPELAPATGGPAAGSAPAHPPTDRFAPPTEGEAPLSLALDRRSVADAPAFERRPSAAQRAAPAPRKRSGPRLSKVVGGLVAASVVVVAAGAVYRYKTLGYWGLEPPPAKTVHVRFATTPEEAEVVVDDETITERPYPAPTGQTVAFLFRAPGRLSVQRDVELFGNSSVTVAVRLPWALHPVESSSAGRRVDKPNQRSDYEIKTFDDLESARAKLELYRDCVSVVHAPLKRCREAFLTSFKRRASARRKPVIIPLEGHLVGQCTAAFDAAVSNGPPMRRLDAVAKSYVTGLKEVGPLTRDLHRYIEDKLYKQDRFDRGNRLSIQIHHSIDKVWQRHEGFDRALFAEEQWLQEIELSTLEAHHGRSLHWFLRRAALVSQRYALQSTARVGSSDLARTRAELQDAYDEALEHAHKHPEQAEALNGSDAFLRSLEPVLSASRDEVATWHNQSISLFNGMILP